MRILLTGASSFTGLWFAKALAERGHSVTAPLRSSNYSGLRGQRVSKLSKVAEVVHDCSFGSARFLDVAAQGHFNLFCHHASQTNDYRSANFDALRATSENVLNLSTTLRTLNDKGLSGVILTGSIFEQDEGAGNEPLRAFSPYGLSKGLTWQYFRFLSETMGFSLGKFVIPNPFGPFEEPRFCNYLIQAWYKGETPSVKTPLYVRDNIHVDLLAVAYARFCEFLPSKNGIVRTNPSFYVESQGAFAQRFAREMEARLDMPCPIELLQQTEFTEPMTRINVDRINEAEFNWSEVAAWNAEADFYRQ
ncbi:NAD(P)-dependent oxidoreductase [Bradyrhizobium sp. WSM1417]|uniref:NAD-dependent epimerase/dehydratase family protein n=1 Tax=Bradyrhizobium sp. WSM1417 TaxID=754500 RepID=UPI0004825087|nr:NAD(P)-dependent oxidoreductase [Bradyrhizobium sp. WSM1417]